MSRIVRAVASLLSIAAVFPAAGPSAESAADLKIAFTSGDVNIQTAIWSVNPDGTERTQLTRRRTVNESLFERWMGNRTETFVMNADGTRQRRLVPTLKLENDSPAWSPDGSRIALSACRCEPGIVIGFVYVVRANGAGLEKLAAGSIPQWSPDGSRLLFARQVRREDAVLVMRSTGGGVRRIATDAEFARWSPDGLEIAFLNTTNTLRAIPATGGSSSLVAKSVLDFDW